MNEPISDLVKRLRSISPAEPFSRLKWTEYYKMEVVIALPRLLNEMKRLNHDVKVSLAVIDSGKKQFEDMRKRMKVIDHHRRSIAPSIGTPSSRRTQSCGGGWRILRRR